MRTYPFPRPPVYALAVKRSAAGLGLFAAQDIPAGRFIVEYWGRLVTDDEADRIGGKYLFSLENGKTIDGTTRENTARYANHACRPNAESRTAGNRMFLYALKRIPAGTEITYDYGKEYADEYIKPHGCRCKTCAKRAVTNQRL